MPSAWLERHKRFHVREIDGSPSVAELIREHGTRIAQVVRRDTARLAESECNEVLQSRISCYAYDLAVIGWNAAFLYDSTSGAGTLARWRLARSATRLHTVLLDVAELTEHADNAIKFLSDMFAERLYKLAALKVGVPDYKELVTRKVHTAEELYRFMVDQFNQGRAFFMELTVVIILVVELVYLFRGNVF
jgi:hypothetical protein